VEVLFKPIIMQLKFFHRGIIDYFEISCPQRQQMEINSKVITK
jgi:hypothetical protein